MSETFDEQSTLHGLQRHTCSIGNPFTGPGGVRLRVQLRPTNRVVGNEEDVFVNFTVGSINLEDDRTIDDNSNFAVVQLTFDARANITIDDG